MKQSFVVLTFCFSITVASLHFNPLHYARQNIQPITPYHGLRFLNHQPLTTYRSVPTIEWLRDVNKITPDEVQKLKAFIIKHGVAKIPNQQLTRKQQMILSEKLGEVIVIPKSFRGRDIHPEYPNIVPISNFWSNGTWKGKLHSFGQYWHKDGNYFSFEKGYIFSLLYADQYDQGIVGGETAFINSCELRRHLPSDIDQYLKDVVISLNVRDIPDFKRGSDEDLNAFRQVHHKAIFNHPGKNEECIFLRLQDEMRNMTDEKTLSIFRLWDYMQNPKNVMQQKWKTGDIIIWDNYGTFHRAMPFVNNEKKRIMYRTQIRLQVGK